MLSDVSQVQFSVSSRGDRQGSRLKWVERALQACDTESESWGWKCLEGERGWSPESAWGMEQNTESCRDSESLARLEQRISEGK